MYLKYFWRVLIHKWYVLCAGFWTVPIWRLLWHDYSKLSKTEFGPYARRFCSGRAGLTDHSADPDEWQRAWLHHWHKNPHHWEHWVRISDHGVIPLKMPLTYVLEMIADWKGAGKAYTGSNDCKPWYLANRDKMVLHPHTQAQIEDLLGIPRESVY